MQPITVALGLTVTLLALAALLAGPSFAFLAPHTRVLVFEYWPALAAYGALAVVSLSSRSTRPRAPPGSRTSGARSISSNGRSGVAPAAIRSWPDRCGSRNVETSSSDADRPHGTQLEKDS